MKEFKKTLENHIAVGKFAVTEPATLRDEQRTMTGLLILGVIQFGKKTSSPITNKKAATGAGFNL